MTTPTIRDAVPDDCATVAAIYAHHVLTGVASYDTVPPDTEAMRAKIIDIQAAGWPFLIIELESHVAGFAYATQIRPRPAYVHTAEDSIYIDHRSTGRGLGKPLLAALLTRTAACGFRVMIAVIGGAEPGAADPHSVALHTALGFRKAGRLAGVGFKFGRRLDNIYMQRSLEDL